MISFITSLPELVFHLPPSGVNAHLYNKGIRCARAHARIRLTELTAAPACLALAAALEAVPALRAEWLNFLNKAMLSAAFTTEAKPDEADPDELDAAEEEAEAPPGVEAGEALPSPPKAAGLMPAAFISATAR